MTALWSALQSQAARHAYMGAIGGFLVALRADYEAFKAWTCWNDILKFDWSIASFRYIKGAIIGAVTVLGLGGFVG